MTPSQYLDRYHNLAYTLDDDSTGVAHLSRYQSGDFGPCWNARGPILQGIARDLNHQPGYSHVSAWALPASFTIEDATLTQMGVLRAFMGKASPDELADVIWLAHRYGLIANPAHPRPPPTRTVEQYVTDFLGLDCNAFVGNYYGLNPETEIPTYQRSARRRTASEVSSGDIVVSTVVINGRRVGEHIALTEGFQGDVLTMVEWGQEGQRHHISRHRVRTQIDEQGWLYYDYVSLETRHRDMPGRKYFHAPPRTPVHRGYDLLRPE